MICLFPKVILEFYASARIEHYLEGHYLGLTPR